MTSLNGSASAALDDGNAARGSAVRAQSRAPASGPVYFRGFYAQIRARGGAVGIRPDGPEAGPYMLTRSFQTMRI